MKRNFILLMLLFAYILLQSCTSDKSKKNYKSTYRHADHLFVEVFTIFGSGAFGGDRLSEYLTDSLTFRKYIGTFDDNAESIIYKSINDTIYIEKCGLPGRSDTKVSEKQAYSIVALKNEHRFE